MNCWTTRLNLLIRLSFITRCTLVELTEHGEELTQRSRDHCQQVLHAPLCATLSNASRMPQRQIHSTNVGAFSAALSPGSCQEPFRPGPVEPCLGFDTSSDTPSAQKTCNRVIPCRALILEPSCCNLPQSVGRRTLRLSFCIHPLVLALLCLHSRYPFSTVL